jgi:hypothetical protein
MRLEDLIPSYPDVSDPQLQRKLDLHPEFAELRGEATEQVPARGEYFKHQRAILRYMRVYDRLFIFHMMGTGKTCAMKSVATFFQQRYDPIQPLPRPSSENDYDIIGFGESGMQVEYGLPPLSTLATAETGANANRPASGVSAVVDSLVEFMSEWDTDIRHAFVLAKSPYLVHEFERQIACECSEPGEFPFLENGDFANPVERKKRIKREIRKWITVGTTQLFVKKYLSRRVGDDYQIISEDEMRSKFSNCLFMLDEVHTMYNEARANITTRGRRGKLSKDAAQGKYVYTALWRLFHVIQNSKVILSSGTPMINNANEIKSEMNLILPEDMQMPKGMNVNKMSKADLEPYFRGRVSYVRELDTGAYTRMHGEHFELELDDGKQVTSEDTIYISTMSEFQSAVYERVILEGGDYDDDDEGDVDASFNDMFGDDFDRNELSNLIEELQSKGGKRIRNADGSRFMHTHFHGVETNAAAFVFPDGSLRGKPSRSQDGISAMAREGLGKYVYSPRRGEFFPTRQFRELVNTPEKIAKYSATMSEIVRLGLEAEGKVYIFTDRHVVGAGAILLGTLFYSQGCEQFTGRESAFEFDSASAQNAATSARGSVAAGDGDGGDYDDIDETEEYVAYDENVDQLEEIANATEEWGPTCESSAARGTGKKIKIRPAERYAIITNFTRPHEIDAILELANSPENIHGEYLKYIIGSNIIRDGINLNNIIQVHLFAGWHASGTMQALSRVLRTTAYEMLKRERRDEAIRSGANPDDVVVEIDVYKHAAVPISDTIDAIDLHLYGISERKDREIKNIERIMKESSVDCVINYNRNIRTASAGGRKQPRDGSAECDYTTCHYECLAPHMTETEISEYEIAHMYSPMHLTLRSKHIERVAGAILYHLVRSPTLRVEALADLINTSADRVEIAAAALQREARVVNDRFGFPCTVQLSHGMVTLHSSFSSMPSIVARQMTDPLDGYYTSNLHVTSIQPDLTSGVVSKAIADEAGTEVLKLQIERIGESTNVLEKMALGTQIQLYEMATEHLMNNHLHPEISIQIAKNIASFFSQYMYALPLPEEDLRRAGVDLVKRGRGRGRKAKADTLISLSFVIENASMKSGLMAIKLMNKCISITGCSPHLFVHTMNMRNAKRTSYSVAAQMKSGKEHLRVLSTGDAIPRWRDATMIETSVIRAILDREREREVEAFGDLYGSRLDDGKFRVHDMDPPYREADGKRNRREESRGRVCTTWQLEQLVGVAFRAGLELDYVPPKIGAKQRDKLLASWTKREMDEIEELSQEQRAYEYAWWKRFRESGERGKVATSNLCDQLEDHFRINGQLETR